MGKQDEKSMSRNRQPRLFLMVGGVLILLISAIWLALQNGGKAVQTGAPAIAVNQERIDFGDVRINTPISFEFEVINRGGSPLRFSAAPSIEVVEGC